MEVEVIEMQLVIEMCPTCHGRGMAPYMAWGADNMDIEVGIDICDNCDGGRYWGAEYLEVAV